MEEGDVKDLEVKRSGAASDDLETAGSSTLTVDRSSGLGNEMTSFEQLGTVGLDADKAMDMSHTSEQIQQMPKLQEPLEPERSSKNVKFNLRKSLAWDSAFFTNDGVLDAEELSTMIDGGEKGVKHHLPGIEEEVYRSMESISTLDSDNLTLESLEAELFEDIRASIQKSSRASDLTNSSIKATSGKSNSEAKVSSSSKKADLDSVNRPADRRKDHTSSIPQPKLISKVKSTATLTSKRASLSANHAKKDQDIAKQTYVAQKGTQAAKITTQGSKAAGVLGPRRAVLKPSLGSKSCSSTALKTEPTRPSSSCGSSSSSSGNDVKSSATLSRRKVDSKTGKPTASSIPKTPSRISMKNNAPLANSRLSSHLVLSNLSASISPASSISEWSSESSSSTSTNNRRSISRGSVDTGVAHRCLDSHASVESSLSIPPTGQNSNQNRNQPVVARPSQASTLTRPPAVQPTGLRMPSPKIGFFDGGKSGNRTPNGGIRSQSRLTNGLPKAGGAHCSPTGPNGAKFGKLPPPKTAAAHTNMKLNPQKTTPKPSQEQSNTKAKPSSASRGIKSSLVTSPEVLDRKGETSMQGSEEIRAAHAEGGVGESSLNIHINPPHHVGDDPNGQYHLVNKSLGKTDTEENGQQEMPNSASEVRSNECSVAVKESKLDKSIIDSTRTPFAVKNSACDADQDQNGSSGGSAMQAQVTEKTVNFPFMESGLQENTKVI